MITTTVTTDFHWDALQIEQKNRRLIILWTSSYIFLKGLMGGRGAGKYLQRSVSGQYPLLMRVAREGPLPCKVITLRVPFEASHFLLLLFIWTTCDNTVSYSILSQTEAPTCIRAQPCPSTFTGISFIGRISEGTWRRQIHITIAKHHRHVTCAKHYAAVFFFSFKVITETKKRTWAVCDTSLLFSVILNVWLNWLFSSPNWTVRSVVLEYTSFAYLLKACKATHVS